MAELKMNRCKLCGAEPILSDLYYGWRSAYTRVTGAAIIKQIERLRLSYGVEFVFCPRRSATKKIMEILQNE